MSADRTPDVSFIMPCYNEQDVIGYTIPQLTGAFAAAGIDLELVAVDNGSSDDTSEIIARLAADDRRIVPHRVDVNIGYGNGVLQAIPRCSAPWIGIIPADGQVDAEDVVKLFEVTRQSREPIIGKVRRRFRLDGLRRKIVSVGYNAFIFMLWPRLGSIDVNGSPKIIPAAVLREMEPRSTVWFLDPEIMLKAHYMGVRVLEMNVFAQMRSAGVSHVRMATCWEFFAKLISYRFGGELRRWRKALEARRRQGRPEEKPLGVG